MKIACISDTHGIFLPDIPDDADVVFHAGDVGPDRKPSIWFAYEFSNWAKKVARPIYFTWGNHDFIGQKSEVLDLLPSNVTCCVDRQLDIDGVKVWFSPWSNIFGDWAFMEVESELRKKYAKIPDDTNIIVSHGPPKGFGDRTLPIWTGRSEQVGSTSLLEQFQALPNASHLICGHIHEARGTYVLQSDPSKEVINCAQVDERYQSLYNAVYMIEV
jgi:Icc-related predicted phosphoesterase